MFRQAPVIFTSMNRHIDPEAHAKPMGSHGGKLRDDLCDAQESNLVGYRGLPNTGLVSVVWRKMTFSATDCSTMRLILFEIQAFCSLRGKGAWVNKRPHGLAAAFSLVLLPYCLLHSTRSLNLFVPSQFYNCALLNTSSLWLSDPLLQ